MHSALHFQEPVPLDMSTLALLMPEGAVRAGFPSPAEDFAERRIDLTAVLVTHPQATFLLRLVGDSMREAGLEDGDLLVVNRALKPRHMSIVVAVVDNDFTVKHIHLRGRVKLVAANPTYPEIVPKDGQQLCVWGVVTASIKRFVL